MGVWMLNVHTLGGKEMLAAARNAIDRGTHRAHLIGVTLLTSHGENDLTDLGLVGRIESQVERLAEMAHETGLDGVVCSPQEAATLRRSFGGNFLLVTPGIRPPGMAADDQQRTLTPSEAVAQGADFLVIGRPITRADDPVSALEMINREIQLH